MLITPLGDLVKRRQLILLLVFLTASLTIGLAVTPNFITFEVLSFLVGVFTVVPQILVPMAADLARPERRAMAISIVLSRLLFGIILARLLAGIIGNFTNWRAVYYMAIGLHYIVLTGAYLILPNYPAMSQELTHITTITSMVKYAMTKPLLIQAFLVNFASSAYFTSFWVQIQLRNILLSHTDGIYRVTLTFLLEASPYNYST